MSTTLIQHIKSRLSGNLLGRKSTIRGRSGDDAISVYVRHDMLTAFLSNKIVDGCFGFRHNILKRVNTVFLTNKINELPFYVDDDSDLILMGSKRRVSVDYKILIGRPDAYNINFYSSNLECLREIMEVCSLTSVSSGYVMRFKDVTTAGIVLDILDRHSVTYKLEDHLSDINNIIVESINTRLNVDVEVGFTSSSHSNAFLSFKTNLISDHKTNKKVIENVDLIREIYSSICTDHVYKYANQIPPRFDEVWELHVTSKLFLTLDLVSLVQKPLAISIELTKNTTDQLLEEILSHLPDMDYTL